MSKGWKWLAIISVICCVILIGLLLNTSSKVTPINNELKDVQSQLTLVQQELDKTSGTLNTTQTALSDAQSQLDLYKDTFGAIVKKGAQLDAIKGNEGEVHLIQNANAINPTWKQLENFLSDDGTDSHPYILYGSDSYICTDFAEQLYNNAETKGIRAAFVVVWYENDPIGHAINAFRTTDRGLVYVDDTGKDETVYPFIIPYFTLPFSTRLGIPNNYDKIAYIQIGKSYGLMSLGTNYGITYNDYLQWQRDKQDFDNELDAYNKKVHNRIFVPEGEYEALQLESNKLDSLAAKLGGFWESGENVKSIEIYW